MVAPYQWLRLRSDDKRLPPDSALARWHPGLEAAALTSYFSKSILKSSPGANLDFFFLQYYLKPGRKKDKSQFTVRKIERGGNQFSKVLQKEMQCCLEQMMGCLCLKFFLFPVEFLAPKKGMCVRACMCACVCVCMCVCWGLWMAFRCYHAMPILRIFNHQHGMVVMAV